MKFSSIPSALTAISIAGSLYATANAEDLGADTTEFLKACGNDKEENVEDVKAALFNGADVNAKIPDSGQTCLMVASLLGNVEIVRYLVTEKETLGLDLTIGENSGYIPTDGAAYQGQAEVMKLLIEVGKMEPHYYHEDGFSPMHRACWGGGQAYADTIRVLLEAGVDVDLVSQNDSPRTCMDMLGSQGPDPTPDKLVLELLEQKGAMPKKVVEEVAEQMLEQVAEELVEEVAEEVVEEVVEEVAEEEL